MSKLEPPRYEIHGMDKDGGVRQWWEGDKNVGFVVESCIADVDIHKVVVTDRSKGQRSGDSKSEGA